MQWSDIRQTHPDRWLLIEALRAHSTRHERVLDDIAVIDAFDDSLVAVDHYRRLHRADPERELYVVHTSRDALAIQESHWLGVRDG